MTPAQCRAARGLLNWSEDRLASAAGIKVFVVRDFEGEKSVPRTTAPVLQRAFDPLESNFPITARRASGNYPRRPCCASTSSTPRTTTDAIATVTRWSEA